MNKTSLTPKIFSLKFTMDAKAGAFIPPSLVGKSEVYCDAAFVIICTENPAGFEEFKIMGIDGREAQSNYLKMPHVFKLFMVLASHVADAHVLPEWQQSLGFEVIRKFNEAKKRKPTPPLSPGPFKKPRKDGAK